MVVSKSILIVFLEFFFFFFASRTLTPGHDAVQKVTLVPRGQARGLTWFIPADDPTLISKQQLFARIVGGLGGRAAEEVIFGEPEVTTGAAGDLQQITGLAKQVLHSSFSIPWLMFCNINMWDELKKSVTELPMDFLILRGRQNDCKS